MTRPAMRRRRSATPAPAGGRPSRRRGPARASASSRRVSGPSASAARIAGRASATPSSAIRRALFFSADRAEQVDHPARVLGRDQVQRAAHHPRAGDRALLEPRVLDLGQRCSRAAARGCRAPPPPRPAPAIPRPPRTVSGHGSHLPGQTLRPGEQAPREVGRKGPRHGETIPHEFASGFPHPRQVAPRAVGRAVRSGLPGSPSGRVRRHPDHEGRPRVPSRMGGGPRERDRPARALGVGDARGAHGRYAGARRGPRAGA